MPSKHKTPLLGWHAPAELSAWVRGEAERRGVTVSVVLTAAVECLRASGGPPLDGGGDEHEGTADSATQHQGTPGGGGGRLPHPQA